MQMSVIGAPKARAQELTDGLTTEIHKYMSQMMFNQHTHVFNLLLTLERLRMSGQITATELGLFVNGVDTSDIEESFVFEDKPEWLSNKVVSFTFHSILQQNACAQTLQNQLMIIYFRVGLTVLHWRARCLPSNTCGNISQNKVYSGMNISR